jgi:hypothetical protein
MRTLRTRRKARGRGPINLLWTMSRPPWPFVWGKTPHWLITAITFGRHLPRTRLFILKIDRVDYRSFSRQRRPLRCLAKSPKAAHAHWVVGKWEPFRPFEMVLIYPIWVPYPSFRVLDCSTSNRTGEADWRCRQNVYQPPNAHVQISGILPSNAIKLMAAAAVKKIYRSHDLGRVVLMTDWWYKVTDK